MNNNEKYVVSVAPKKGTAYNPLHEEVDGCEAVILEASVGNVGWFSYKTKDCMWTLWHTMHTSLICGMQKAENKIVIDTQNTVYTFEKV